MEQESKPRWRSLAEQAAKEDDPQKLLQIVQELNRALEVEENSDLQLRVGSSKRQKSA